MATIVATFRRPRMTPTAKRSWPCTVEHACVCRDGAEHSHEDTHVELTHYLWTTLKIRAAERQTTAAASHMTALRAERFSIAKSDMIDASGRVRSGQVGRQGET